MSVSGRDNRTELIGGKNSTLVLMIGHQAQKTDFPNEEENANIVHLFPLDVNRNAAIGLMGC
jgi:hypothetical protein